MTSYAQAMTEFIATAKVELPNEKSVAGEGAITMELDGETFVFNPDGDTWSFTGGVLSHKSGATFTPKRLFDNQGLSQLNVFKQATGSEGVVWEKFSFPQVIGAVGGGKTHACAQIRRNQKGDSYVLLTGDGEAEETLRKDLSAFLRSRVADK